MRSVSLPNVAVDIDHLVDMMCSAPILSGLFPPAFVICCILCYGSYFTPEKEKYQTSRCTGYDTGSSVELSRPGFSLTVRGALVVPSF